MQGVAPGSSHFEEGVECLFTMLLGEGDNFRNYRTIHQKLEEHVAVGICESQQ